MIAALVFAISFSIYRSSPGRHSTGDTESIRRLPFALLSGGTADLSGDPIFQKEPLHYSAVRVGDRVLPAFPIGTALVATPVALGFRHGRSLDDTTLDGFERTGAAAISSLTVLLFFLALTRWLALDTSVLGTLVFAFGTNQFSTASQGLWPFTGELCLLVLGLALAAGARDGNHRGLAAGLALSGAVLCRPTALLFLPVFAVLPGLRLRRILELVAGTALGLTAVLLLQKALLGNWLGPYVEINRAGGMWVLSPWEGLSGVLVSPSRGLLPFFPFVLVAVAVLFLNRSQRRPLHWRMALAYGLVAPVLLAASYAKWWGGDGLGPRLLTETSPFLALIATEAWTELRGRTVKCLMASLIIFSIATQFLLVFRNSGMTWNSVLRPDANPERLFSWRDSQLAAIWLKEWHPSPDLTALGKEDPGLLGSVDSPAPGDEVSGTLVLRGWARVPGEDLAVEAIIDGVRATDVIGTRHARPDVASALPMLGDCSKAGYELRMPHPGNGVRKARVLVVFRTRDQRVRHYPEVLIRWRP